MCVINNMNILIIKYYNYRVMTLIIGIVRPERDKCAFIINGNRMINEIYICIAIQFSIDLKSWDGK